MRTEIKNGVAILWDCLQELKNIPDGSIDAIICDLPYGATQHTADKIIPFAPMWSEVERVIKDNGAILFFAQGIFYVDLVASNRRLFRYDLVWDKVLTTGFLNAKRLPLRQHEQIAVFYKHPPVYNPQFKVGKPSHWQWTKRFEKEMANRNYGSYTPIVSEKDPTLKYPTSIFQYPKTHPSKALHRTEKSIPLLKELIQTYSNEWDTILDFTAGSLTLAVAAEDTGRKWIYIEQDEECCSDWITRLNVTDNVPTPQWDRQLLIPNL